MEIIGKQGTHGFSQKVGEMEKRKLKALANKQGLWFGLGMFGMVGWSVVVPLLLGAGLGILLDKNYPQTFSWTITLLFAGLFSGCMIAWHWVSKEYKAIDQNKKYAMNIITMILVFITGLFLGTVFFGLLWLTVQKVKTSKKPALLFLSSFIIRISLVVSGFYLIGFNDYKRLLLCLSGFILGRFIVMRKTRRTDEKQNKILKIIVNEA